MTLTVEGLSESSNMLRLSLIREVYHNGKLVDTHNLGDLTNKTILPKEFKQQGTYIIRPIRGSMVALQTLTFAAKAQCTG